MESNGHCTGRLPTGYILETGRTETSVRGPYKFKPGSYAESLDRTFGEDGWEVVPRGGDFVDIVVNAHGIERLAELVLSVQSKETVQGEEKQKQYYLD